MPNVVNVDGSWQGVSVLGGQILEAIGIQLLYKSRSVKSLFGRFISVFWGLLSLTVGFLVVLASIDGIDKAIVLPLVGSLIIIGAIGATFKMLTRLTFVREAQIRNNWQTEWLRRCVLLTNSNLNPDSIVEFDHYSALVHIFDDVIQVCKPSVNRGLPLILILTPFYILAGILQRMAQFLEDLIHFIGSLVFVWKVQWKTQGTKMPFLTDMQLDLFENKQEAFAIQTHGNMLKWALHLFGSDARKEYRNSWVQCMSSLHVANILSTTAYSSLLRRSMLMETPASLFGRMNNINLRLVAGSWYGRKADFLTALGSNLQAVQGLEPGLQLVWNAIICNEQIQAPSLWANGVLTTLERRSAQSARGTEPDILGNRELNHVATSHKIWFIEVAMYCWWNMVRCESTDQMVEELITSKFENYASVIISTAETVLQKEYTISAALVDAIGPRCHAWLMKRRRQQDYWIEIQPELPPSGKCYGMRTIVEALEVVQERQSDFRKEAYAVVAAGLWSTVAGNYLQDNECEQVVQLYNDPMQVQDLVVKFAKAYWNQTMRITPSYSFRNV